MNVKELRVLCAKRKQNAEARRAAVEDLAAITSAAEEEAEKAAAAGDVDGYMRSKAEADKLQATLYVTRKAAENEPAGPTIAEVLEAWKTDETEREKAFKKTLKTYQDAMAVARKAFSEMLESQTTAIELRQELGNYIGISGPGENADETYRQLPLLATIPAVPLEGLRYMNTQPCPIEIPLFLAAGSFLTGTGHMIVAKNLAILCEHKIPSITANSIASITTVQKRAAK